MEMNLKEDMNYDFEIANLGEAKTSNSNYNE